MRVDNERNREEILRNLGILRIFLSVTFDQTTVFICCSTIWILKENTH